MITETTLFQSAKLVVTDARFIVAGQTFALRGITSVRGVRTPASYTGSIGVMALALAVGVLAIAHSAWIGVAVAILGLAGGGWWACQLKPAYAVVLTTAAGEVSAYESNDWDEISQLIDALNRAIVSNAGVESPQASYSP